MSKCVPYVCRLGKAVEGLVATMAQFFGEIPMSLKATQKLLTILESKVDQYSFTGRSFG